MLGLVCGGIADGKMERLGRVLEKADDLRLRTVRNVVEMLTPQQAVQFLIAAAELQFGVHIWGLNHDRRSLAPIINQWPIGISLPTCTLSVLFCVFHNQICIICRPGWAHPDQFRSHEINNATIYPSIPPMECGMFGLPWDSNMWFHRGHAVTSFFPFSFV